MTVALWRVTDPGNVGTLMRTADAFGAAVSLSPECADPLGPRAVRASAGAIFASRSWSGTTRRLAASPSTPTAATLAEVDLAPPLTLLLGSEREGLPEAW